MSQKLHIIDALGPLFVAEPSTSTINWSKVVFSDIETKNRLTTAAQVKIVKNFRTYIKKVASLGYDAISIDDLAHMVCFDFYDETTKQLLADYHSLYAELFAIAAFHNMAIYVNTDYIFSNKTIDGYIERSGIASADFFTMAITQVFDSFPTIAGIILRIGEKDGNDVHGTFLSKLQLRTPREANVLLKQILPVFEAYNKQLIFRTWTVGAYKIGDLIWNEKTYDKVFKQIESDALIVSMKFGDTDFMRYLALNPLLFRGPQKKLLELQTRREWEGMGVIPSFVGWDYEDYLRKLAASETFVGIHVWCQTGGWAKREWTNRTYLQGSSFWNELNTEVTIAIANTESVENAIAAFCKQRNIKDLGKFTELLRLADIAMMKGFYIADIASQTLYFRRTRIPPLLWLTWDKIYLPHVVVYLHRMLLPKHSSIIADGDEAVEAAKAMRRLASELQLNSVIRESIDLELETLVILAGLRRHITGALSPQKLSVINQQIDAYEKHFPNHYSFTRLTPIKSKRLPRPLLTPFVRKSVKYRKRDRLFITTSSVQARLLRIYLRRSRSHLADQSMGLDTLFK